MPRYLFIVSRENVALFEYARERFADDENVEVILDRRIKATGPGPPMERRRRDEVSEELRINSYAIVTLS
jgi:hypothetical protein